MSGTYDNMIYVVVDSSYISIVGAAAGLSGMVTIPSTITHSGTPYEVQDISSSAFKNTQSLVSINIPLSVTTFGSLTFENCTSLTSITFNGACPTDLNANGALVGFTPFLNLPASANIYVYYAYSSTNPSVGITGFATSYIRGSSIPVVVLDPPIAPYCSKCPKPVHWNTAQNVSNGSINSTTMRLSNRLQQNKNRGQTNFISVVRSGRPSPKN